MITAPAKHWFALYTKPRWEKKVHADLVAKGIDTYLPLIRTLKQWSDRKKMVEEPLFRSYIFVNITPTEHDPAVKTRGVVKFVHSRGKAIMITPQEIEAVKAYVGEGEDRTMYDPHCEIGDSVEIRYGAMKGLKGKLVDVRGRKRVLVEIESICEKIILNLPAGYLTRIH
jgi:transcription antitermination factor NusG